MILKDKGRVPMNTGRHERGSASIEATISLTMFVLSIISIYTIVNFCIIQAKVAYAVNATAKEMSQYAYFYHLLGLERVDQTLGENKQQAVEAFETMSALIDNSQAVLSKAKSEPDTLVTDILKQEFDGNEFQSIARAEQLLADIVDNPVQFLKSMAALAGQQQWDSAKARLIAAPMAKGMTRRHFGQNSAEANAYLKSYGVVDGYDGINFKLSTIFAAGSQDIVIVAVYNLELLPIFPFSSHVTIVHTAVTRGWLGGDKN